MKTSLKAKFFLALFALCLTSSINYEKTPEEVFTAIYENQEWGINEDQGRSGTGASFNSTKEFRTFLQKFLISHNIKSVVDVGCGDWIWARFFNWKEIEYIGYDAVKSVIVNNQMEYSYKNINFVHADALTSDLPEADLLICKDVLQHLPIEDIFSLMSQFYKFKYCIIQNDASFINMTDPNHNGQIKRGMHRTLDLTQPPFDIYPIHTFTYIERNQSNIKKVIVISNFGNCI